jgi:ribosomal protein S18 acetylase RimI-like enzyme
VREALEAQREFDLAVAGAHERVDGGWLLLTPEFSRSWELNKVLLDPGAGATEVARGIALAEERYDGFEHRRVCVPDPREEVVAPPGWQAEVLLVMLGPDRRPPWPEAVREVDPQTLYDARVAAGATPDDARLQIPFGNGPDARPLAHYEDGAITGWCELHGGSIDDVWVLEPHRGRGIGRALTRAAMAAGGWFLLCDEADPRPQTLYRSLGFTDAGRVVNLTRRP